MRYPSDDLTPAERERLAPHVTDLDGPVFALVNLPATVKGALFARYSRYPGTLRRLFLDEFADSVPEGGSLSYPPGDEGERSGDDDERADLEPLEPDELPAASQRAESRVLLELGDRDEERPAHDEPDRDRDEEDREA